MTLTLTSDEREELERRVRSRKIRAEDARRARVVLMLAAGESYGAIGATLGCYPNDISRWKRRFEAENPSQRIKLEITVSDGLQNRALAAIRSGSPPELMEIQSGWNIPYAATGGLMSLDEVVTANNIALNDFLPAPLGTARYENKLMGMPYRCEAHGLIYNKAHFREAGLNPDQPPRDWNETFLAIVRRDIAEIEAGRRQREADRVAGPPPRPLTEYAGRYDHAIYGPVEVKVEGGKLLWAWSGFRAELQYWRGDTFTFTDEWIGDQAIAIAGGALSYAGETFQRGATKN